MERLGVRCAIHTRQSVARPDNTDFTSCDAQREACTEFVQAHRPEGWLALEERFDDVGESGATIERPALTRLLERVQGRRRQESRRGSTLRATTIDRFAAEDIERRVLAWLHQPAGDISPAASFVLARYAPIWEVLFPETVRRAVAQLVWEVRWDGRRNEFAVVLDETAIAEEHAKIVQNDEERAKRPKPRRRKAGLRRGRARQR